MPQGYLVYSSKQKLKPELAGLPGNVIRDRRLAGEVGALASAHLAYGMPSFQDELKHQPIQGCNSNS